MSRTLQTRLSPLKNARVVSFMHSGENHQRLSSFSPAAHSVAKLQRWPPAAGLVWKQSRIVFRPRCHPSHQSTCTICAMHIHDPFNSACVQRPPPLTNMIPLQYRHCCTRYISHDCVMAVPHAVCCRRWCWVGVDHEPLSLASMFVLLAAIKNWRINCCRLNLTVLERECDSAVTVKPFLLNSCFQWLQLLTFV